MSNVREQQQWLTSSSVFNIWDLETIVVYLFITPMSDELKVFPSLLITCSLFHLVHVATDDRQLQPQYRQRLRRSQLEAVKSRMRHLWCQNKQQTVPEQPGAGGVS